jgi:hypothetical protein
MFLSRDNKLCGKLLCFFLDITDCIQENNNYCTYCTCSTVSDIQSTAFEKLLIATRDIRRGEAMFLFNDKIIYKSINVPFS